MAAGPGAPPGAAPGGADQGFCERIHDLEVLNGASDKRTKGRIGR